MIWPPCDPKTCPQPAAIRDHDLELGHQGCDLSSLPSIDFTAERPEGNLAESATLRLVQELDTQGEQHEPGEKSLRRREFR